MVETFQENREFQCPPGEPFLQRSAVHPRPPPTAKAAQPQPATLSLSLFVPPSDRQTGRPVTPGREAPGPPAVRDGLLTCAELPLSSPKAFPCWRSCSPHPARGCPWSLMDRGRRQAPGTTPLLLGQPCRAIPASGLGGGGGGGPKKE